MFPFKQKKFGGKLIREFSNDVNSEDLVWHRDRSDRYVTVMEGKDWYIQFDNKLPIKLVEGQVYYIPAHNYHRVMKGSTNLVLEIKEIPEMKITRRQLRKIIQEVYQMTPEDEKALARRQIEKGGAEEITARKLDKEEGLGPRMMRMVKNKRRALGLQYPEEQETDRANLKRMHNSVEYESLVKAFNDDNGEATAIYDLTYQGTFTGGGNKEMILNIPEWISRYGHQTKNSISTKAFLGSIKDIPASIGGPLGIGIILRGYPVLVSAMDAYSQTQSASPQGLKDFHASSGFVKRGDMDSAAFSVEDWLMLHDEYGYGERGVSHETILDN